MWQKCPICGGEGTFNQYPNQTISKIVCPTCNGTRIISEITGLPPTSTHLKSNPTTYTGTDFRDSNMESQTDYFNR